MATIIRNPALLLFAPALLAVAALPAGAHTAPSPLAGQLRQCGEIIDAQKRLNCFDRLLAETRQTASEQIQKSTAAAPETEKAQAKAPPPRAEKTAQAELGQKYLKQKRSRAPKKEKLRAELTLVKTEKDSKGRHVFFFDNGQVWRQLRAGYLRVPKTDRQAAITEGILGSHTLQIEKIRKPIKVKRLQ